LGRGLNILRDPSGYATTFMKSAYSFETDDRDLPVGLTLGSGYGDVVGMLLRIRTLRAFDRGAARYPVHRTERCAVRRPLDELLEQIALQGSLTAQRLSESSLLLDGPATLVHVQGKRKSDYTSLSFDCWAESVAALHGTLEALLHIVGEQLERRAMFTIDWQFSNGAMGLASASFDEMADAPLLDEAYPSLGQTVAAFIDHYLASRETVLILQGPPGTGKTRLVRAQGRKILFTTNLPNISDIDDALVRPGRCFAIVRTRALEPNEAAALLLKLAADPQHRLSLANATLPPDKPLTLAAIYRLVVAPAVMS
jgi:hypothetical protein